MALEYFLYTTLYNNTLVDRSKTSFAPLPPDTGQIYIDFLIPETQPLYYYANSGGTGGTIVLNSEATIEAYLAGTAPPIKRDDDVQQWEFTGVTSALQNQINVLSGFTASTQNIYTNTQDPTGFLNNQNIKLTYNSAGRTITLSAITGTIQYYWNGVLKSLGTSWTSTAHPATTSAYFLYSTDGTNFTWTTSVWAFTDVIPHVHSIA